eukprot:2369344-Pleurochrysis_carterae.AAC.1
MRAKAAGRPRGGGMTFDDTKKTEMPPIRTRSSSQAPADHSLQLAHAGEQSTYQFGTGFGSRHPRSGADN